MEDDLANIEQRYARRRADALGDRYVRVRPEVAAVMALMLRSFASEFRGHLTTPMADARILEVGTGAGTNMLLLLALGASPANLVANDLLPDRLQDARVVLPESVMTIAGDAGALDLPAEGFDVVLVSTVFSSILHDATRRRVATGIWRLVAPGGGVLWHDFRRNNPRNHDVRRVTAGEIKVLFPEGRLSLRATMLAPPIARAVCRTSDRLYAPLHAVALLRTHLTGFIAKPHRIVP